LKTILICLGIAVATIGVGCAFGAAMRRPEFLIAGTVFLGIAAVLGVVTAAGFEGSRGRAIRSLGAVQVACPRCGYSMAGLGGRARGGGTGGGVGRAGCAGGGGGGTGGSSRAGGGGGGGGGRERR